MRLVIALALVACILIAGCGGGNKLVGKWQGPDGTTLDFRSSGKVDITLPGSAADTGTYKTENGKLAISSEVWNAPEDWMSYSVSGETMTYGEPPNAVTYTRVK